VLAIGAATDGKTLLLPSVFGGVWGVGSPVSQVASLAVFWGSFWNRAVALTLREGVYVPLLKAGVPRPVASVLAFSVSGLNHCESAACESAARGGVR
jgi:hypothetical protein